MWTYDEEVAELIEEFREGEPHLDFEQAANEMVVQGILWVDEAGALQIVEE